MILDFKRASKGKFLIMADVTGSYGEQAHIQVGRYFKTANAAIAAAERFADNTRGNVCVRNVSNGWMYTVQA